MTDRYTHGHQESVVNAHATRTIANSAAYLESYLTSGVNLLDVGCGPGSITAEFADRVGTAGSVLGIDNGTEVIALARESHADSAATFEVMDLYALPIDDDTYDIVHAHQVLQHVSDPVAALREMHRVAKPGGIIAVRDADYAGMHWAPAIPALTDWLRIYRQVAYANNAEPDAGRHLIRWAREAGLRTVEPSLATWLFAEERGRSWWGSTWSDRVRSSSLAAQAIEGGFATADELESISTAWLRWAGHDDAWFVVPHAQLICRV